MKEILLNPHFPYVVTALLVVTIFLMGAGIGVGRLLGPVLRRFLGRDKNKVTVNVGAATSEKKTPECLLNPELCTGHGEEKARSLQNQKEIGELKDEFHAYREIFFKEIRATRRGISKIAVALVAKKIINPQDFPKEGD